MPVCADESCRLACPGPSGSVFWPGRTVLYEAEKMLKKKHFFFLRILRFSKIMISYYYAINTNEVCQPGKFSTPS